MTEDSPSVPPAMPDENTGNEPAVESAPVEDSTDQPIAEATPVEPPGDGLVPPPVVLAKVEPRSADGLDLLAGVGIIWAF